MKKLAIVAGGALTVAAAVRVLTQMVKARGCPQDPRWNEAILAYKRARERNAPEVEVEAARQELGRIYKQIQAEQGI